MNELERNRNAELDLDVYDFFAYFFLTHQDSGQAGISGRGSIDDVNS